MSSGRGIRPYGLQAMLVKVGKDVAASVGIYILIVDGDFYKTEYARWLYDMDFFTLGTLLFSDHWAVRMVVRRS